jgi:hypothetical protein
MLYLGVDEADKGRGFTAHLCFHTLHFQVQIGVAKDPGPEVQLAEITFQDSRRGQIVMVGPEYAKQLADQAGKEQVQDGKAVPRTDALDVLAADILRQAITGVDLLTMLDTSTIDGYREGRSDVQAQFRQLLGIRLDNEIPEYDEPEEDDPPDGELPVENVEVVDAGLEGYAI